MKDWRLPPLRRGHDASAALVERRRQVAGDPNMAGAQEMRLGGVRCMTVGDGSADRTMLYLHGGGYRMGDPAAWAPYARRLADAARARVVLPDYRLAPEHPFPAALHDVAAVYETLRGRGPIVVAGDSAGGGLAAALAIAADHAARPAAGAILVSPMLDLQAQDETYDSRAGSDALFSRASVVECAALYLQGHPADDPLVSPGRADPGSFPPTLLLAGGAEVLLGETLALARRLALADRRVSLHVAPGMGHVWPMMAPDTCEAADAAAAIGAFVLATLP